MISIRKIRCDRAWGLKGAMIAAIITSSRVKLTKLLQSPRQVYKQYHYIWSFTARAEERTSYRRQQFPSQIRWWSHQRWYWQRASHGATEGNSQWTVWITYCYESLSGKSFQAMFVLAYGNQGHRADSRNLQGLSVRNKTPKKAWSTSTAHNSHLAVAALVHGCRGPLPIAQGN
jgi:hypothetical protein